MDHVKRKREITLINNLKRLILIVIVPVIVLPLTGCTTLSTEPATIVEPVGHFSQTGEVPLQSHWWKSLPDAQLQTLQQSALAANLDVLGHMHVWPRPLRWLA